MREREIAVKEREVAIKADELKRSRWANPIVLAVLAATLAALGNGYIAYMNGKDQRDLASQRAIAENSLEANKAVALQELEENKAEAARILEVIKTNDPDKTAVNLTLLLETGLIVGDERKKSLTAYLAKRLPGAGPTLPTAGEPALTRRQRVVYSCTVKDAQARAALPQAVMQAILGPANPNIAASILRPGVVRVTFIDTHYDFYISVSLNTEGIIIDLPAFQPTVNQDEDTVMSGLASVIKPYDPDCLQQGKVVLGREQLSR